MTRLAMLLFNPTARPFTVMVGSILLLALIDRGTGFFFSVGTIFSVMQLFATFGLVALGLGLSILIREFDLSVAGIVGLAGCIAVMTGAGNPWLGLLLGVGAGLVSGVVQGLIMTRLHLSSVGVTLGGLLTLQGLTYVLTDNKTIGYPNISVALELNAPIARSCLGAERRLFRGVRACRTGDDLHPYRPRRDRNRQRPARRPHCRPQHRSRRHRRVCGIRRDARRSPACF